MVCRQRSAQQCQTPRFWSAHAEDIEQILECLGVRFYVGKRAELRRQPFPAASRAGSAIL